MNIYFSRYTLNPAASPKDRASLVPREGALLKVEWTDGHTDGVGYADCHPWPEYGDLDLDEQLKKLKRGSLTDLTEQSIWLAKRDALLRSQGQNAIKQNPRPKSHYLLPHVESCTDSDLQDIRRLGFEILKCKVGRNPEAEAEALIRLTKQYKFTYRLDFNALGDYSYFDRFIHRLDLHTRKRIEYVEDPCPYDPQAWKEANDVVKVALDLEYKKVKWTEGEKPPFQIIILKPAVQDVEEAVRHCLDHNLSLVVTSYMDHPVGQVHAAYIAGELKKTYPSMVLDTGILSHSAYQFSDFTSYLKTQGPYLHQVDGTGIGFDSLLERQTWVPLKDW
jgi:O-succinylbenzoate synthase